MITKVEAYICICDGCGGRIGDGEEEQDLLFHYCDDVKHYAEIIGWKVSDDGHVLCHRCQRLINNK